MQGDEIDQVIAYLVKLADWAAGQGFCQIEGIQDPDEWVMQQWDTLGKGDHYTPEALAAAILNRLKELEKNNAPLPE